MFDDTFYPTPGTLVERMLAKRKKGKSEDQCKVLEPSAGDGAIVDRLINERSYYYDDSKCHFFRDVSCIEIDPTRQATLRGKNRKVIDSDFLTYAGPDKFDLIIANPPFDHGDAHLLKAIDIMYRGEIIFLLNAETIKNPHTNLRKMLVQKLTELNADIEYIPGAFIDAQRTTGVEVALVYINIERDVEADLFAGCEDMATEQTPGIEQNYEVSTRKGIAELVAEYDQIIKIGTETILGYFRNYRKIGNYIGLDCEATKEDKYSISTENMTSLMQGKLNNLIKNVRISFWRKTLDLREVQSRMTSSKAKEFECQLTHQCNMDFTENNIRQFVLNLIGGYEETITSAVLQVFDQFTINHCYSSGLYDDNIHMFNGWKTNNAFRVGKKVIVPVWGGYGKGPFADEYSGKWKLHYGVADKFRDIDVVMNYFDGLSSYTSIAAAMEKALDRQQSSKIDSTYFTITCYKKGTVHLTFKDENILRRFNVVACKGKNWLPHEYGKKAYGAFSEEEKAVVESFEGKESYIENQGKPLFETPTTMLRIAA